MASAAIRKGCILRFRLWGDWECRPGPITRRSAMMIAPPSRASESRWKHPAQGTISMESLTAMAIVDWSMLSAMGRKYLSVKEQSYGSPS